MGYRHMYSRAPAVLGPNSLVFFVIPVGSTSTVSGAAMPIADLTDTPFKTLRKQIRITGRPKGTVPKTVHVGRVADTGLDIWFTTRCEVFADPRVSALVAERRTSSLAGLAQAALAGEIRAGAAGFTEQYMIWRSFSWQVRDIDGFLRDGADIQDLETTATAIITAAGCRHTLVVARHGALSAGPLQIKHLAECRHEKAPRSQHLS